MSEDDGYSVECMTRKRTTVLRGVMRLEHDVARERVFAAISADLAATEVGAYTIDVSDVLFMNSSAFGALASLVLAAKRARRRLVIVGRRSVPWQERTLGSLSPLYDALEVRMPSLSLAPRLQREPEFWAIQTSDGRTLRLKDSKGLSYLEQLVAQPGRELHVLQLVGAGVGGDAGPLLDTCAKVQYRDRLSDLEEELAEAELNHDEFRATRAREEIDAISRQLAEAVGLGGRDRRGTSELQRARINVQRCLKETLERIATADPALGRYLNASIKTGTYCSFTPL